MKAIQVNKYLMPILVVVALLGSVWIAKAAGVWQTSGRGQILLDEGGQPDPLGIKGWMTLSDVSETYGVPLDAVYVMIGAASDIPPDTALKDLERLVPDMEVSAVRAGVAAYLAGVWKPADGRFGGAAVDPVLEASPTPGPQPTPEPEASPEAAPDHVPQGGGEGSGDGFVLPEDGSRLPGSEIRGRMTLQEVVDHCQVPLDYLVIELGLPEDVDTGLWMRDLANQLGIEVATVREVVERYQAEQ
jgi:hypothetical protein